jgi:hypothetical protein
MNLKNGGKHRLKMYEPPPTATIFPFQRRHVVGNQLKLPELPVAAMRLFNGMTQTEALPTRGT